MFAAFPEEVSLLIRSYFLRHTACLAVLLVTLSILCPVQAAIADQPTTARSPQADDLFIPVDEIEIGSIGIGKTVFRGTAVEEFGVEVLGVLRQGAASDPYIIVRVFGDAIDRAGGIADGMSGSPVYLDGRLAGALSHVYTGSTRDVGLVTPIAAMLRLMTPQRQTPTVVPEGATPVESTLLVSGIAGRSLGLVRSALTGSRRVAVTGSAAAQVDPAPAIEPGSAIAVQLIDGDIEVSTVGTVTYVDSEGFVAFGHHFEAIGTVDYIASGASVTCILESEDGPFKVAEPLAPFGRVTQDRFPGVAGEFGALAETASVAVRVRDAETGEERSYRFSVINDERFVYSLVTAGVLQAFDSTLSRIGEGTSTVALTLGLSSGQRVSRVNTFCDWSDIAMWSLSEISEAVSMITSNEYEAVKLVELAIDAEISPEIRTARIEIAEADRTEAMPGDTLTVRVTLRPYRSSAVVKEIRVDIPADAPPGYAQVVVQGGSEVFGSYGYGPLLADSGIDGEESMGYYSATSTYGDLSTQLLEFSARPRSTDLVVDLYVSAAPEAAGFGEGSGDASGNATNDAVTDTVREVAETERLQSGNDDPGLREGETSDRPLASQPGAAQSRAGAGQSVRVVEPLDYVTYGWENIGLTILATDCQIPDSVGNN
jgi:hypothetical protein